MIGPFAGPFIFRAPGLKPSPFRRTASSIIGQAHIVRQALMVLVDVGCQANRCQSPIFSRHTA